MSEQDGKIVNLGGLKKFKEYYDTDIITPINNKIDSKTNVQSGETITTNNDTIGYFKNIKINGNTRYKKSDGTYTDTWESGVSLESVGENEKDSNNKYPIEIASCGKNLFSKELLRKINSKENCNLCSWNEDTEVLHLQWNGKETYPNLLSPKVKKNTQYAFSFEIQSTTNTASILLRIKYTDGSDGYSTDKLTTSTEYQRVTIVSELNKTISYIFWVGNDNTIMNVRNLQIEEGTIATNYEPYKEDKRTVLLDSPLRGIGAVKDMMNFSTNKIVKNFNFATYAGEDTTTWNKENLTRTNTSLFGHPVYPGVIAKSSPCMANTLPYNYGIYSTDVEGVRVDSNGNIQISIAKSKLETDDVAGFKKWLQSNPVTVVYQLATPTTEDIDVSSNTLTDYATSCTLTTDNTIKGNIECSEVVGLIPSVEENGTRLTNVENSLDNKAEQNHNHRIADVTGLQDKLDEVFQSVSNGKTLLETAITDKGSSVSKIGDVATFEELKTGIAGIIGTGACELNIFTQTEEPSTKDGIWLKTSNTYDDVLNISDTPNTYTQMADIPYEFYDGSVVSVGSNIYLLGGFAKNNHQKNYKYDTTTGNYTRKSSIPYEFYDGSAVSVGSNIYLLGGTDGKTTNYKYDTTTNYYTSKSSIPYEFYMGSAVAIGNNIYLLGGVSGAYKKNYKYDTTTDTYTKMADIPYSFDSGSAVAIGNDIYILGGDYSKTNNYKYDTLTDTYTQMADIPYDFGGSAVAIGNCIYILGGYSGKTTNYKYDTTTNTYTKMADIPYEFYQSSAIAIGNNIYLLGGNGDRTKNYKYYAINICKNSILFLYDNMSFKYKTKIFNTPYGGLNYINFDSVITTDENGNNTNVETYIGNGTSWNKI